MHFLAAVLLSVISQAQDQSFSHRGLNIELRYASAEAARADSEVRRLISTALDVYVKLFGGVLRDANGRTSTQLQVQLSLAPRGEGNADPGLVQVAMGRQPMFGFYTWQMTLLHELFHLWSAESFRYRSDEEQWFNEALPSFTRCRRPRGSGYSRTIRSRQLSQFRLPSTRVRRTLGDYHCAAQAVRRR